MKKKNFILFQRKNKKQNENQLTQSLLKCHFVVKF